MKIGDKVNIMWENIAYEFNVEVIQIPYNTGESFVFKRQDGSEIWVQHYCKIEPFKEIKEF